MTDDWSRYLPDARTKPDNQLELESENPDHLGGNAGMRAAARVEIKRRDREAAEHLARQHLAIAAKQATFARLAVWAACGSALATFFAAVVTLLQMLKH